MNPLDLFALSRAGAYPYLWPSAGRYDPDALAHAAIAGYLRTLDAVA
jgi:hypothetical protein